MVVALVAQSFLPFLYAVLFIWAPIRIFKTDYGWSVILLFWAPSVVLYIDLRNWMSARMKKAFWLTVLILLPVTFAFEYLCLVLDIWNFYEGYDKLWGLSIFGAPVEEFIFWFGATPCCLLVYCWYYRVFKGGRS